MSKHNTIRTHFWPPFSPLALNQARSLFVMSRLSREESKNVCESCYVSAFLYPLHRLRIIISQSPGKKAKRFKFLADNNESGGKEERERELKFVAKRV